jgi:hypothetical protein
MIAENSESIDTEGGCFIIISSCSSISCHMLIKLI